MLKKFIIALCILVTPVAVYSYVNEKGTGQSHGTANNGTANNDSVVKQLKVENKAVTSEAGIAQEKITALFRMNLGIDITSIKHSVFPGLVEVLTDQGIFYASPDGNYLFVDGQLYGFGQGIVNHTEASMAPIRIAGMEKFKDDMIVYPAKNEKHVITVFTDITCGYCRRMHNMVDEYNRLGITVRYLAYPRFGVQDKTGGMSQGFKDLRSIWCSENPNEALTKAKAGNSVPLRICDKPIAEEFKFGRQVGVNGTPAIMLESGQLIPGFVPPQDLLQRIERS